MSNTTTVAESSLEFLLLEIISYYTEGKDLSKDDEFYAKLEDIGTHVGERLMERETLDHPRITNQVEAFKYIGKDFWTLTSGKAADALKTNNSNKSFSITDKKFRWLGHVSFPQASYIDKRTAGAPMNPNLNKIQNPYLAFFIGLLKGALIALDLSAVITAMPLQDNPYGVIFSFKNIQTSSNAPSIPSTFSSVPVSPPYPSSAK